jgi:hypothetical protein
MRSRRDFIGLAAGAVVGWPLVAQSQPRNGMRRLGVLMGPRERAILAGGHSPPPW